MSQMTEFQIDPRLQADCLLVSELPLCRLLLMDDARWPWLILVPRIIDATEIHLLDKNDQQKLQNETSMIADILSRITGCEKINTGALGNIVRQLHVHVIARSTNDENWPGPVWGYGKRKPYEAQAAQTLIENIQTHLAGKQN